MPNKHTADGNYRYAFQGQEKDPETEMEAFELRLWDGRLGRWLTVDPYHEFHSPYVGMGNNPANLTDPDGGCTRCPKDAKVGDSFYDPEHGDLAYSTSFSGEGYWSTSDGTVIGNNNFIVGQKNDFNGWTSFTGGLQMVGGGLEFLVGGVGGVLTAETGVGAAVGYTVAANGIDNAVTGFNQMISGKSQDTYLHKGVHATATFAGASEETAENIATGADIATIALGGGSSIKNTKFLKQGGKINGISKGSRSAYGAQKRFDIHPLLHPSRKTSTLTLPTWVKKHKIPIPHYHRGKGNNLRYHRPWELDPTGKRKW